MQWTNVNNTPAARGASLPPAAPKKRDLSPTTSVTHDQLAKRLRVARQASVARLHCHSVEHSWGACQSHCAHCSAEHPKRRCPKLPLTAYAPGGFKARQTRGFGNALLSHSDVAGDIHALQQSGGAFDAGLTSSVSGNGYDAEQPRNALDSTQLPDTTHHVDDLHRLIDDVFHLQQSVSAVKHGQTPSATGSASGNGHGADLLSNLMGHSLQSSTNDEAADNDGGLAAHSAAGAPNPEQQMGGLLRHGPTSSSIGSAAGRDQSHQQPSNTLDGEPPSGALRSSIGAHRAPSQPRSMSGEGMWSGAVFAHRPAASSVFRGNQTARYGNDAHKSGGLNTTPTFDGINPQRMAMLGRPSKEQPAMQKPGYAVGLGPPKTGMNTLPLGKRSALSHTDAATDRRSSGPVPDYESSIEDGEIREHRIKVEPRDDDVHMTGDENASSLSTSGNDASGSWSVVKYTPAETAAAIKASSRKRNSRSMPERRQIVVSNLAPATTESDLRAFFHGVKVGGVFITRSPLNGGTCDAILELDSPAKVLLAASTLSCKELLGRKVKVRPASAVSASSLSRDANRAIANAIFTSRPVATNPPFPYWTDGASAAPGAGVKDKRITLLNLPSGFSEAELRDLFKAYTLEEVSLASDPRPDHPAGYTLVALTTPAEAARACAEFHGTKIHGHKLAVLPVGRSGLPERQSKLHAQNYYGGAPPNLQQLQPYTPPIPAFKAPTITAPYGLPTSSLPTEADLEAMKSYDNLACEIASRVWAHTDAGKLCNNDEDYELTLAKLNGLLGALKPLIVRGDRAQPKTVVRVKTEGS